MATECEKCKGTGTLPQQGWAWREGDRGYYWCECPAGVARKDADLRTEAEAEARAANPLPTRRRVAELEARVVTLTEERDALVARLTPEPKRSKVVCPGCKRSLADVVDSLIRQRGKFKAQRQAAEREAATLREALDRLATVAEAARGHYGIEECSGPGRPATEWDEIQDELRDAADTARAALAGAGRPTEGEG